MLDNLLIMAGAYTICFKLSDWTKDKTERKIGLAVYNVQRGVYTDDDKAYYDKIMRKGEMEWAKGHKTKFF